eukprot:scaffold6247_cov416-Prasinococcus_capsulatus_cf.AAC.2
MVSLPLQPARAVTSYRVGAVVAKHVTTVQHSRHVTYHPAVGCRAKPCQIRNTNGSYLPAFSVRNDHNTLLAHLILCISLTLGVLGRKAVPYKGSQAFGGMRLVLKWSATYATKRLSCQNEGPIKAVDTRSTYRLETYPRDSLTCASTSNTARDRTWACMDCTKAPSTQHK